MPSPSPTPVRAVYGFVLYLAAYVGFVVYIIWAYIPDTWLEAVGITYWPQKYWAVAIPCFLCMLWVLAYPVWFGLIQLCTASLDSLDIITDNYANKDYTPEALENLSKGACFPLTDLDISDVNRQLYL